MSWFNYQVYTTEEVNKVGALELPCNHQIGDEVVAHVWYEDNTKKLSIKGKLVGVRIGDMHRITYDIAVKIEGQDLWVTISDIRGHVTNPGEYSDPAGGLIDVKEIEEQLENVIKNKSTAPTLTVVKTDKE